MKIDYIDQIFNTKIVCIKMQTIFFILYVLLFLPYSILAQNDTAVIIDSISDTSVTTSLDTSIISKSIIDSFYLEDNDSDIASIDTSFEQNISLKSVVVSKATENKMVPKKIYKIIKKNIIRTLVLFGLILLIIIIWYYLSRYFDKSKFLTSTRLSLMDKEVQIACRHMEKNYFDPGLNINKICKEMVTGSAFLGALFEKELGMGVDEFLMQVRINRARILLDKDSDIELSLLSSSVGYVENEFFISDFKKSTGISIEEYINTISI